VASARGSLRIAAAATLLRTRGCLCAFHFIVVSLGDGYESLQLYCFGFLLHTHFLAFDSVATLVCCFFVNLVTALTIRADTMVISANDRL